MGGFSRHVWAILWKDILWEWRRRETLTAMLVFGLLTLVTYNFAFDLSGREAAALAPGVLWLALIFAGMLGLGRAFGLERESGCLEGLLLAPVSREAIYVAKVVGNVAFIVSAEAVLLPAFAALFNVPILRPDILVVLFLGTVGFGVIGTLFAAMTASARAREALLPVLILPLLVPVVIAGVKTSSTLLAGEGDASTGFSLLAAFDVIFLALSLLACEHVLDE
ncbi:MAG: heme exporter protein CcmB [Chloroflexi bacterium]|nr:heme exporter protein CcmB [Chloroflexota bacterium]